MIRTINSWRGLMAVTIVLFHAGVGWMWNVAVTGVTFFFLSSTFLLAMRHPFERLTARGYGRFAVSHALRLYPLHWLGLALLIALGLLYYPSDIHWGPTALSALLIHSWFPAHDIHYGINPVAWYLCALLFCYLIYPFMAHWLGRWRLRYKVMLAVILAAVLAIVLLPLDIPGREAVFVNPLSHVLDIVVGLILIHLYHLLKARAGKVSFGTATLIECGALVLLAVAIGVNMATTWVKPWEDVLIWLVPQGCILLVLALLDGREGAIGKVLLFKPLQWLGSISFEVYVLQFVAFHLFNYLLSPLAGHFGWLIYDKLAWLSLLLLVPLAWAVNRLFTRPLRKMINAKFKTT
ncbi:MAG: acyltransferase [Muribaculaceae bacterium]|nr:acyltransferase [Muribaculaceae bacterium]